MEGGCKCCREWEEHYYWNHRGTKRARFYKIMTHDFSQQMKLPKKFTDRFEGQLLEILDLKGPSGNIWHVGLSKVDGDLFLQSGWTDFVEAHHIKVEDLLVFNYEGDSRFDILIFEGSGCEKASAFFVRNSNGKKQEMREESLEILHVSHHQEVIQCDSSSTSHGNSSQALPQSIPHKFSRAKFASPKSIPHVSSRAKFKAADNNQRILSSSSCRISESQPVPSKKARGRPRKNVGGSKGIEYHVKQEHTEVHGDENLAFSALYATGKRLLTEEGKVKVMQMVHAVKPENPFFISVMQPSHVNKGFFVSIPAGFVRVHLPSASQDFVLQTPDKQRKWSVSYLVQKYVSGFSRGWNCFVDDNNLRVEDICLFELVQNQKGIVMTVYIFRATDKVFSLRRS